MAELLNIDTRLKLKKFTCDIYSGKHIITSIDVQAENETKAVEIAAQALKIKPRKRYE